MTAGDPDDLEIVLAEVQRGADASITLRFDIGG